MPGAVVGFQELFIALLERLNGFAFNVCMFDVWLFIHSNISFTLMIHWSVTAYTYSVTIALITSTNKRKLSWRPLEAIENNKSQWTETSNMAWLQLKMSRVQTCV